MFTLAVTQRELGEVDTLNFHLALAYVHHAAICRHELFAPLLLRILERCPLYVRIKAQQHRLRQRHDPDRPSLR